MARNLFSTTIYRTVRVAICSLLLATFATLPSHAAGQNPIFEDNAQIETVASGFQFTEGPVWHPGGFLLFSDLPANRIYQWQDEKIEIFRQDSGNADGNALDREGRLLSAEYRHRRISRLEKDGTIVTLASQYEGKRLNSPNDLVVKSDGSIYFTDPSYGLESYGLKKQPSELGFSGVYRISPDGQLTLLVKDLTHPNGIAFSPNEQKLYVSDFRQDIIWVFDVQHDGTLRSGIIFAQPEDPDGIKVDSQGNVYSTGLSGLWVFSPSGQLLDRIELPEVPANLTWGDRDYKSLYITARKSIYRLRMKVPGSGTVI